MSLSPGTRLGPYDIIAAVGAGGMGEVYRARDTKLGRDVAIKVLPEAFAHDAERMARFEREAHVLASLNHPYIAGIHGLEESNDIRALVMELVEGPTLAERIAEGAMPLEEALAVAKQIAEGLEYAHEKGVVHRDLKPANVKLTADGGVKLLDFGLAKALDKPASAGNPSISPTLTVEATRAGLILGTAAYMAPEQARGAVVDKRADIWAFGVVLYELLTGNRPFVGETVSDTLAAVLKTEPEWDALPAGIRRLVRRCLAKNPNQRLRDIGDARLALEDGLEITAMPAANRRMLWKVAAGVLAMALLVSLALLWRAIQPMNQPLMRLNVDLGPESVSFPTLSPDGTLLVYSGRGTDGKLRLYRRRLDQEQAVWLAGTEDVFAPFFSPDGQFVGFFADGKLKRISIQGGAPVVLCDAPAGRGGSWGEDGNIVAALNTTGGLSRVSSAGGMVQHLTELKQENDDVTHRWPQVLPGAQAILFTAHTTTGGYEDATIVAQSLRTGERKALVRGGFYGRYVPSGHLIYVRQGTLYAAPMNLRGLELTGPAASVVEEVRTFPVVGAAWVDFSRNGTLVYVRGKVAPRTLVWLDSTGHTQPLPLPAAEYYSVRFSPDGKQLAIGMNQGGNPDVWVYEWGRDTMTRLTFALGQDSSPVWSPDGKNIVFSSERHQGAPNLYCMRADGAGDAVRLTESKNAQFPCSFSPDGKRLAFAESSPQTKWDVWTLPFEAVQSDHSKRGKPESFLQTPFSETEPMISPDGRWLAYVSDESGRNELYVRPFPGPGGKWQVSAGGGRDAVWSKKGQKLFYASGDGIMVVSYTASGEAFVASKPRLWAGKKDLGGFDLAPDGKRFAVLQTEASEQKGPAHVTFLLNVFDELRRRALAARK